jgi:serine/threonine-protein kinase
MTETPGPPTPTLEGPPAPQSYGPYLLHERIGHGGMAEVFRAVRQGAEGFAQMFALKRITPAHADSKDFVEMFVTEARVSAMLSHPNIVQVYDFGEVDGSYYLAMEYLKGKTVLQVLRTLAAQRRPFPAATAGYIGRKVALGLAYAHSRRGPDGELLNLVHRDINPANVMVLRSGEVKVLDFGIAKAPSLARQQTQAGFVKGKISYASPEQLKALPLDGRSDVFSLGVMLWEMLAMKKLFAGENDFETVNNVVNRPVPAPSSLRADVPAAVDDLVLQMLERDPTRRPDAREVANRLGDYLRNVQYLEDALVDLLRDLFGAHTSRVFSIVQGGAPLVTPVESPAVPAAPGGEPRRTTLEADALGPESTTLPPPPRQARVRTALFAAASLAGLGVVVAVAGPSLPQLRGLFSASAPPEPGPAVSSAPAAGEVVLELDSRPTGASITDGAGRPLGTTPAVLRLPRATAPITLVVEKAGYDPLRFETTPARDSIATVELRPAK